jgi:hypothetical protein
METASTDGRRVALLHSDWLQPTFETDTSGTLVARIGMQLPRSCQVERDYRVLTDGIVSWIDPRHDTICCNTDFLFDLA